MDRRLAMHLSFGSSIRIADCTGTGYLRELAELLQLEPCHGGADDPAVTLRLTGAAVPDGGSLVYTSPKGKMQLFLGGNGDSIGLAVAPERLDDAGARMDIWHYLAVCAGISAVLRGTSAVLMHGAALVDKDGETIILCAESGVGKSTTSCRWQECGGDFAADDMFLLERSKNNGSFQVYPLPTWSRCRIEPEPVRFPADSPLPVAGILGLSRNDNADVIEKVSPADFLGQILRSFCYHTNKLIKFFPAETQQTFSRNISAISGEVLKAFPPCGLFASLAGDLPTAIADYRRNHL